MFLGALATLCSDLTTGAVAPSVSVSERRTAGYVGESRCSRGLLPTSGRLEAYVALGHVGRPEGGLHEQAPRATAPFLSADFPRFGWRRAEF